MLYVTYMDVLRVVPAAQKLEQKLTSAEPTEKAPEQSPEKGGK